MRTCTQSTLAKIATKRLTGRQLANHPAWLRATISDCMNGHSVSLEREDRMCRALGIPSPKRPPRRFYRPCLSVELGEIMREYGWSPEVILWQWVREYQAQEAPCQS
jgi:hypothetical protein